MAFRISLNKASKAQLGSKARAEEDAKDREEKNALDKVMADLMEEHGDEGGLLGEREQEHEAESNVFVPTGSRRHFTGRPRSMKSGPGTLDSEPGAGYSRPTGPGGFGAQNHSRFGASTPRGPAAFEGPKDVADVYATVVALASNLPPAIEPRQVEELFEEFPSLKVTKTEKVPPTRPSSPSHKARPSATMKITFDKDANPRDLDNAMIKLNDKKYLGKGYYLHLDRYLGGRNVSTRQAEEPFGASLHEVEVSKGYAPPPDLGGSNRDRHREEIMNKRLLVTANAPPDRAMLKLIHMTVEAVMTGGTEFEAALMQDPQVQEEERFAWLFNQKHPLARYYRWRLNELAGSGIRPNLFENQPDWKGPKEPFADEYASELWDLDDTPEGYDEEDDDEMPARVTVPLGDIYPGRVDTGYGIMSPRARSLLIWLLATLPPSSPLSEEIAAFSAFAVDHVTKGLDEVVYLLITNIFQPFFLSKANPKQRTEGQEGEDDVRKRGQMPQLITNGLRIISDVALTTSKESGACYKYRTVIGTQLVERKVFEYLETVPSRLSMGRMTERQYRDEVNAILTLWQDEHLFEKNILDHLEHAFNARKREMEQEEQARKQAERRRQKKGAVPLKTARAGSDDEGEKMDVDEDDMGVVDTQDGANDGHDSPASRGESAAMAIDAAASPEEDQAKAEAPQEERTRQEAATAAMPGESAAARARRLRPRAEDMFASDEE